MQWLTAFLAFAVTMLVFATIVSTFVEMIHRAVGLRRKGLQVMLENLYDKVIVKRVTPASGMNAQSFAKAIMTNRAIEDTGKVSKDKPGLARHVVNWLLEPSTLNEMPVEVFTQKLADSAVVESVTGEIDDVIKDISQKFEAFGDEASVYFERRARLFSVLVGLVVAYVFYVHPYNIATTYVKNPEVAQTVAEMAANSEKRYGDVAAKLNETIKAGTATAENTAKIEALLKDYEDAKQKAIDQTKELADIGVPVGWNEKMPVCNEKIKTQCWLQISLVTFPWPGFGNALWLVIGGLLVGLGAPFWAKAVANLTSVRDVVGKITNIVVPQSSSTPSKSQADVSTPKSTGIVSVEAFKLAR